MKQFKRLCMITVLPIVTGCTMLTSTATDDKSGWPTTAGGIQYSLPKALIKVKLSEKSGILRITMEQPTLVADPEYTYLLRYKTSPFSSDKFDIEVDPSTGLLKKIDMTADDKTGNIIVEIAKAVATLESAEVDGETVLAERIVDPADEAQLAKVSEDFNAIVMKNNEAKEKPKILLFRKKPIIVGTPKADCSIGACYRPTMPYIIGFSFGNSIHYETQVNLPNEAPAIPVSLDRTLFVNRKNTIEFENGILKKGSLDKPSEGLEIAKLPVNIMKGILSAPAEILQLKFDLVTKEKSLTTEQAALIDAEKTLKDKLSAKSKESSEVDGRLPLLTGTSKGRTTQAALRHDAQNLGNSPRIDGQIDNGSKGTLPPQGGQKP